MAVTLEIRIRDLLPEFLADALIFLGALKTAGAIATGALQALLDGGHHFLILIQTNSHENNSFLFLVYHGCQAN